MKFALINGLKTEATKGLKGFCQNCGSDLIAKCGEIKMHHWAHRNIQNCDRWWENETEWHRMWKNNYPEDWQEKSKVDILTGEKHIADVLTGHDLVIECQHSHIDPKERAIREEFYNHMIWVVDGTRLKRDLPRFLKGQKNLMKTSNQGQFLIQYPEDCFPKAWLTSSVPVVFDFLGLKLKSTQTDQGQYLYYLVPNQGIRERTVFCLTRESFIANTSSGKWPPKKEHTDRVSEPKKHSSKSRVKIKSSPYVLERGRWKRKKRF
jgi:competence protein CoiA